MKKVALYLLVTLYLLAGFNHFWHPEFYLKLMPPYFPAPVLLNYLAGFTELCLGAGMLMAKYRKISAIGLIVLLVLFIPVHVYTIQTACPGQAVCFAKWATWSRLFVIHPVLIAWAWWLRK